MGKFVQLQPPVQWKCVWPPGKGCKGRRQRERSLSRASTPEPTVMKQTCRFFAVEEKRSPRLPSLKEISRKESSTWQCQPRRTFQGHFSLCELPAPPKGTEDVHVRSASRHMVACGLPGWPASETGHACGRGRGRTRARGQDNDPEASLQGLWPSDTSKARRAVQGQFWVPSRRSDTSSFS